jgi:hypothetical protein
MIFGRDRTSRSSIINGIHITLCSDRKRPSVCFHFSLLNAECVLPSQNHWLHYMDWKRLSSSSSCSGSLVMSHLIPCFIFTWRFCQVLFYW